MNKHALALALLAGVSLLSACGQTANNTPAATRPAPGLATSTPPSAGASTGAGAEASRLGDTGKQVYQQQCQSCHGNQGQGVIGPALIGSRASPAKYGPTAEGLYTYIRTNMPQTAPGSLSADEYLAVTTYLLLQNQLVSPTQRIDVGSLQQIKTER